MKYNVGVDVALMLAQLDPGVKRAVLRVLSYHVGRQNAVSRTELVAETNRLVPCHDRQVRLVVNELRKEGALICSTGGIDGGYWLAQDMEELRAYLDAEVWSRVGDLTQQAQAMVQAGMAQWGPVPEGKQLRMLE